MFMLRVSAEVFVDSFKEIYFVIFERIVIYKHLYVDRFPWFFFSTIAM